MIALFAPFHGFVTAEKSARGIIVEEWKALMGGFVATADLPNRCIDALSAFRICITIRVFVTGDGRRTRRCH